MDYLRTFMRIAVQVGGQGSRPNFRDRGLRDFELERRGKRLSPQGIARDALVYFCLEEGRFNGFVLGIKAVLQFLSECKILPADPRQVYQDLGEILKAHCTPEMIQRWLDSL
ncbi:MAG TPA: hypothetical protein VK395_36560 [Gemmataceae bacterium]|nr:hypothetical protein [Gemmataceae bacterium]